MFGIFEPVSQTRRILVELDRDLSKSVHSTRSFRFEVCEFVVMLVIR
jgi:hypothetical protein